MRHLPIALTLVLLALTRGSAGASPTIEVRATLMELPRTPPCEQQPLGVTARYRVERVERGAPLPGPLFVVHRCPELFRGERRSGKGSAPPLRPGQTHLLALRPVRSLAGVIDPFSPDPRPRYEALSTDPAPELPRMVVSVIGGPGTGRQISFDALSATLGRAPDADVLLSHPAVALHHLLLAVQEGMVEVRPLPTAQGTRLNGQRLRAPRRVTYRDRLEVGPYTLSISLLQPGQIGEDDE